MGTLDEHWCNVCKRKLDKKKDKYVEFELVNMTLKEKIKKKIRKGKPKGIICQKCIDENSDLKKAIELMVRAGNPTFQPIIYCNAIAKPPEEQCSNFEPAKLESTYHKYVGVQTPCKHIAVIRDKIYCKRSHPGILKLPREKAEVRREEGLIMQKMLSRYIKDPKIKELLKTMVLEKDFLQNIHVPPSAVVEAKREESIAR